MSDLAVEVSRLGEKANNTEKRVNGHEIVCAQRYGEITNSFSRVHSRLDGIMKAVITLLITMLLSIIGGVVGIVAQILMK